MKNKLIFAYALLLVGMGACKKEGEVTNPAFKGVKQTNAHEKYERIPQKMMQMTAEQTLAKIKKFKAGFGIHDSQNRLVEADSVNVDTSLFVMEAALNYEFDFSNPDTSSNVLPPDTSEYTIPINRVDFMVNSDDLEDVYTELSTYISSLVTSTDKVKVVDLNAYVSGYQVLYRAVIIRNHYFPTVVDCAPFANSEYATYFGCHLTSCEPLIEYKLLSCKFLPCPMIWYYNVYSPATISNINNASAFNGILYYVRTSWGNGYCDNTQFSPTQMSNYVNNIYSYVNSIKPSGYSVANCHVYSYFNSIYSGPSLPGNSPNFVDYFWQLDLMYAQSVTTGC